MDLLSLLRLTLRRWALVVPVLLVALLALVWLGANRGSDYEFDGSYLLSQEVLDPTNEPLDPGQVTDVLEELFVAPSVRADIEAAGLSADYAAARGQSGTSLRLTVNGASANVVLGTTRTLLDMLPVLLAETFDDASVDARPTIAPDAANVTRSADTYTLVTPIVVSSVAADSGNPFEANLSTAQAVVRASMSADFALAVEAAVPTASFVVTNTNRDAALVDVKVNGPSEAEALAGYETVRDLLQDELRRLQTEAGVNPDFRTILRPLIEPAQPTVTGASLVRPAAAVVILGAGLAVALAIAAESFAVARARGDATGGLRIPRLHRPGWLRVPDRVGRVPGWLAGLPRRLRQRMPERLPERLPNQRRRSSAPEPPDPSAADDRPAPAEPTTGRAAAAADDATDRDRTPESSGNGDRPVAPDAAPARRAGGSTRRTASTRTTRRR